MRRGSPVLVLLVAAALGGCSTRRTLRIQSAPPGARVWVNGAERGRTPLDVPFVHYGRFDVRLEHPGYEALAEEVVVPDQLDGYPVVDLPLELTVRQRRFTWTGRMRPLSSHPTEAEVEAALARAKAFRARTLRETAEGAAPPRIER
jgi:PEGA domain